MYSIDELPLQDLQNFWSLLYMDFCRKICTDHPAEGETVIRRAIAETGRRQGEWQRQEHEQMGLNTNLHSFCRVRSTLCCGGPYAKYRGLPMGPLYLSNGELLGRAQRGSLRPFLL